MSEPKTFILAASGEADSYRRDLFEARIRATVRYADPAAALTRPWRPMSLYVQSDQPASCSL